MTTNPPPKYNVIYIVSHDQGIAASSYAGEGLDANPDLPTPNHKRLMDKGTILLRHFGSAPMCSPARGTLMTGLYPHSNGLIGLTHRGFKYNDDVKTVVSAFRDGGYRTALAGVKHEGDPTTRLGYEQAHLLKLWPWLLKEMAKHTIAPNRINPHGDPNGKPFWLSIGTGFLHRIWGHWPQIKVDPKKVHIPAYLPQDSPSMRKEVAQFESKLKYYDRFLGKIIDMIDKLDLWSSTIVVLTTDHGVAHAGAKGLLYEPGCHTMMSFTGGPIINGRKLRALASRGVDFTPTICELCGIQPPNAERLEGKSYASLLIDPKASDTFRQSIASETTFADIYNPIRSIRTNQYRYIRNYVDFPRVNAPPKDIKWGVGFADWKKWAAQWGWADRRDSEELYDLEQDLLCRNNLTLISPALPELAKMQQILLKHLESTDDLIRNGPYPAPHGAKIDNAADFSHLKQ